MTERITLELTLDELKILIEDAIQSAISKVDLEREKSRFVTTRELQEILQVSRTTVYNMEQRGKITPHTLNGHKRWSLREVENALLNG